MQRPRLGSLGAILAVGLIALATLTPTAGPSSRTGFLCLGCGTFGAPDVVVNVFLFLPLGIVLGRAGWRPLVALGVGLALSAGVEFAQAFIPGRSPTLRDVFMNGVGAAAGALLAWHLAEWLRPGMRTRALLWGAAAGVLLAVGLTGALFRFEPPRELLYGQWVPDQGHLELFSGKLREATVGGIAVAIGPSQQSDALRDSLHDSVSARLVAVAGRPTRRLSSIFSLMDHVREEALLIGPHGEDLVVRVRRAAATWRMDAPEFRFRNALAGIPPGVPLTIDFDGTRLGGCATVNGTRHCVGRPRAGSTWQLARSFEGLPPLAHRVLDALTLVVLVFPFGLLLRSVARREAVIAGGLLVIGFPIVAWSAGLALPTWEWIGVALGVACGLLLHARLRPADKVSR